MRKSNQKVFLAVISIVAMSITIALLLSSCSNDSSSSSQPYYQSSSNGSNNAVSTPVTQSSSNGVVSTPTESLEQKFSCSSGQTKDYELPYSPEGLQIVTDHGDVIIIGNEYGPTDNVNWFYNGHYLGKYAIGTISYPVGLNKGSRVVMKLDGTTGDFNPDTEFYNFITVCSSWAVTTVTQPSI